jgi:hypothetical protein
MAMKETWFQYRCTTSRPTSCWLNTGARVPVERSLNNDFITWTVSARLPEGKNPPRASRQWQNRMWG